jgi:ribosomal protein L11 methyltransferase
MEWFRVTLSPTPALSSEDIDTLCCLLMESGAAGTTVEADGKISCFINGERTEADRLAALATKERCAVLAVEPVKEENWNQQCSEVWQPVDAGHLKVVPVETSDDSATIDPNTIKIIPGQGFGTGHHPTTRMILQTLSERTSELGQRDLSIFDLGTGSGILAIAAAKVFNRPVEAVDNDPYAITNAVDNVALNNLSHLVAPSTTPIEELKTPFNLILANLYGEVLVQLAPEVTRLALPGCVAIMSGITELVRDSVVDTYTENHGWVLDEEKSENGWHCVTLTHA